MGVGCGNSRNSSGGQREPERSTVVNDPRGERPNDHDDFFNHKKDHKDSKVPRKRDRRILKLVVPPVLIGMHISSVTPG